MPLVGLCLADTLPMWILTPGLLKSSEVFAGLAQSGRAAPL